jgi:ribonuclease D
MIFKPSITKEELELLPAFGFQGKIFLIESPEQYKMAEKVLFKSRVLGFDTESKAAFKKGVKNQPALIQLATEDSAFLFRIHKLGIPDFVLKLLSSTRITKVGVALSQDVKELQQIAPFKPANFIDLQPYSGKLGIIDNGLKKLAGIVLELNISKGQRLSNWNAEVLSENQLEYAATDAWVTRAIYIKLKQYENELGRTDTKAG